ncbi:MULTISPECIES: hypothetical protein [Agromyces]|uniref:WXG100 family type VII secretion target n=1 Tax=Agromyces mediolanus TaxID=41986 RepID=A0A918F754_AGRME|nr:MULTISPECIES: hypothetical protein [Agromyces]MCD1570939.1 hypothetical protein [Agromyces mediolanus]GGR15023.1 hypothetical protein GCM10010196_04660 [Agromyces mediolanus]GLJ73449.1 hypothetical protein GCM10017583_27080 [Agromyces mediolanus]GLU89085.1 hypothetical protein Agsp01_13400 [Agromyces sp. NBRC 114283]
MVQFRVRASALSEVAALLGTVLATFDTNLSTVDAQVKRTVDVTWKGDDAESFSEGWATFMTTAGFVRQSLAALQAGLIAADGSYTQNESGVQRSFTGRAPALAAMRSGTGELGKRVASGEEKAEDMAEFFGRDYAGDDEVEQFGGGALGPRKTSGQATGGGSGDTDGDGDDDSIGEGVFRLGADGEPAITAQVAPVEIGEVPVVGTADAEGTGA